MIFERILSLLESKSLKMADLCKYLGINTSTMSNWKTRGTDPPSKFIAPICEFLDVSCEFLLTGAEKSALPYFSAEDQEWLSLIHQLPDDAQAEFRGEIKGYLKRMKAEESVAADQQIKMAN